ncbi:MAG TPA: histidine phosphatase family protein [Methylophilaceae bacterium]|nr:histidine phosphatase family protein [Methylophilaceae bacterium]
MELLLWRHAEAAATKPDIERALTLEGQKQAVVMASWLRARLPNNTRILVSPARRTQETAAALGMDFSTCQALAPGAEPEAILEAAGWPNASDNVLVVSHQPALGAAAALAITGHPHYWNVDIGNVWWLSSVSPDEKESGVLRAIIPAELAAIQK